MLDQIRQNAQSWGVKIAFGIIILVFVFWGVGSMNSGPTGGVVAKVNDEPVLITDFSRAYQLEYEALRRQLPDLKDEDLKNFGFKRQVLQKVVTRMMLLQEAERMGIEITPQELKKAVASIPSFQNAEGKFDAATYTAVLKAQGMTAGQFERDFTKDLLMQKVQETVMMPATVTADEARSVFDFSAEQRSVDYLMFKSQDYLKGLTASEEELTKAYEANKDSYKVPHRVVLDYLLVTPAALAESMDISDAEVEAYYADNAEKQFTQPESVTANHILVQLGEKASDDEVKKAEAKIAKIVKAIKGGMSFADAAKKWSEGPSASSGGALGTFTRGRMVKPFEDAAFDAKVGEVSKPVRTMFGLHLIKVDKHEQAGVRKLDDVRDEVRSLIAEDRAADKVTEVLDSAVEQLASGKSIPEIAKDLKLDLRTSVAFTRDEAEQAVGVKPSSVDIVFNQPEGTPIDSPLEVEDGYMLARVVSSTPEFFKALEEVRTAVEAIVLREKAQELANKDAAKALEAIKAGGLNADQKKDLATTAFFGRRGFVPGIGMNAELAKAVFATSKKEWLGPFNSPLGAVIVRLKDNKMPTDQEWKAVEPQAMAQLLKSKQQELFQTFIKSLSETAVVEVTNPEVLKD